MGKNVYFIYQTHCCGFSSKCLAATSLIRSGPSTSGKPCPRLTQSYLAERADIVVKMVVAVSPKAGEKGGGGGGAEQRSGLGSVAIVAVLNLKPVRPSPNRLFFRQFECTGKERKSRQVLSEEEAAGESFPCRLAQQKRRERSMRLFFSSDGRRNEEARGTINQSISAVASSFFSQARFLFAASHFSPKLSSLEEPCEGPRSREALCSAARRLDESRCRKRHRICLDLSRPRPRPWPPQTAPPPPPPRR